MASADLFRLGSNALFYERSLVFIFLRARNYRVCVVANFERNGHTLAAAYATISSGFFAVVVVVVVA